MAHMPFDVYVEKMVEIVKERPRPNRDFSIMLPHVPSRLDIIEREGKLFMVDRVVHMHGLHVAPLLFVTEWS